MVFSDKANKFRRGTLRVTLLAIALMGTTAGNALASNVDQRGVASYYADYFQGRTTASGEVFNQKALTAAHRTLPFGTTVTVTRRDSGEQVEVVINDRGPFVDGRVIDLSKQAARELGMLHRGTVPVDLVVQR